MGFSGVASSVIMFIAVLSLSTGVVVVLRNYVSDTGNSVAVQKDIIKDQIKSDIHIDVVTYDDINLTTIYVKNSGRTQLSLTDIDVYIDKARTPRNDSNRTITLLSDTDSKNIGNWDPDEIIQIDVVKVLGTGNHEVLVKADHQSSDKEDFSN